MVLFSERHGHQPARAAMRLEQLDDVLRVKTWDVLHIVLDTMLGPHADERLGTVALASQPQPLRRRRASRALIAVLRHVFGTPLDVARQTHTTAAVHQVRGLVLGSTGEHPWWAVLDCIEVLPTELGRAADDSEGDHDSEEKTFITAQLNTVMETYGGGYRIIDGKVVPMTSASEVSAVEEALSDSAQIERVRDQLESMLSALSARPQDNYLRSAQEALDAVEALVRHLTGKNTLSVGLRALRNRDGDPFHQTIYSAWEKLYGYRGDELQHAKGAHVDLATARYLVVQACAFCSLLLAQTPSNSGRAADARAGV